MVQASLYNIPTTQQEIDIWSKANNVDHQSIVDAIARATSKVLEIVLTTGGTGYSSAPTVTIAPPDLPGGTQATAIAEFVAGVGGETVGFTITNPGLGYSQAPKVTLSGGGGTGLGATAVVEYVLLALPQLDPITLRQMDDWNNSHFLVHEAMLTALGLQSTNLTTPDFKDRIAMQEYIQTHMLDHLAASAALLGYLPNAS